VNRYLLANQFISKDITSLNHLNSAFGIFLKNGVVCLRHSRNSEFWLSLIILVITVITSFVFFFKWYSFIFFVGPYLFSHWFSLIGFILILIFVPIYYVLRRRRPRAIKMLLRIHVFGNLFSFLLISSHFAQHLGRLAAIFPYIGSGIISFLILSIIVATGFLERFQIPRKMGKYTRIIHRYMAVLFYLIIFVHMLHGFNVI
jgi:hypothetical protein